MQIHGSCACREGAGILLLGRPGSGKSDLVLRLLDHGFALVADDRVDIEDGIARAPAALAGLLEVRGLGILRLPYVESAPVALVLTLDEAPPRLPMPARHPLLDRPMLALDPAPASAAMRVRLALDCALARVTQVAGAFAP